MTQEQAHAQTEQLIAPYPNTYTFTKAIGEHILLAEKGDVPLAIVRPSIVGCAYQYPLPGWVDSMIAASGLFLMLGVGALHSMHGNSSNVSDIIPVDTISTLLLSAAWRTAVQYGTLNPSQAARRPSLPIYHGTTSTKNPTLWSTSLRILEGYFRRHPPKRSVGMPWAVYVPNKVQHRVFHHAVHTVPAAVSDAITYAKGGKPTLVKKSGRLLRAVKTLAYFTCHQWFYSTENVDALIDAMNEEDIRLFPIDVRKIDWELYFLTYAQGLRRYMLKEVDELDVDNPQIRAKL
jgi:fatty acyl-CoA reductase